MSREYSSAGAAVDAVERGVTFKHFCAKTRLGKMDFALASETLKCVPCPACWLCTPFFSSSAVSSFLCDAPTSSIPGLDYSRCR